MALIGCLVVAACSGGDVATETWIPVEAAGYTMEMPAEPVQETFEAPSAIGPIAVETWLVEEEDGAVAFAVNELPEESTASGPDPVLQGAVNGAASNLAGTAVSDVAVEGLDLPGARCRDHRHQRGNRRGGVSASGIDRQPVDPVAVARPRRQPR